MNYVLKMSLRNLMRNKRRSVFSALAIAIGTALLLFMSATIRGEMRGSLDLTINLRTGHLQIHAEDYKDENMSLKHADMIEAPLDISDQIEDTGPDDRIQRRRIVACGRNRACRIELFNDSSQFPGND